ncbi:hypothetical protein SDC9_189733 [bioreactor metagenome]|uniref:GntR C-terminal domain-containing protein n=1 Tax=bioreactor metagenome TaxID=1076179 RepID=A0A645HT94_9ZZZZ
MLCAKGLMQSIPYVGSSVRKLSNDEIREVYLLRSVLEPLAGRISASQITPDELRQLHALQEQLEAYGQKPISLETSKQMYQLNREFHMSMYRPCRMDRLIQMIDSLWDSIAYLRMRTAFNPKYPEQMQEEHRRYISLLEQKKGDDLARHLEENLRRHVGSFPANGSAVSTEEKAN